MKRTATYIVIYPRWEKLVDVVEHIKERDFGTVFTTEQTWKVPFSFFRVIRFRMNYHQNKNGLDAVVRMNKYLNDKKFWYTHMLS
jgi:hypothetical protein